MKTALSKGRTILDWLLILVVALIAASMFGTGGGGGGGGCSSGCWDYPDPSMGVDNVYHYGAPYSTWNLNGAGSGFVIQAGRPTDDSNVQPRVNSERNDALSALSGSHPVYVYFCMEPDDTQEDVYGMVDTLGNSLFLDDLTIYQMALIVVLDIEQGDACGSWDAYSFSTAKTMLNTRMSWIKNRAWAVGLGPNSPVCFSSVPGVPGVTTSPTTTTQLGAWLANGSGWTAGCRIGVMFPQLFGPNVWAGNWQAYWGNILGTYSGEGVPYTVMNPNYQDVLNQCPPLYGQSEIDEFRAAFSAVTGSPPNINTWYVWACPWPAT
jgi:hypothetical protein